MKKTVVVTGAGGLLGSEIIRQLNSYEKENWRVIAITSQVDNLQKKYSKYNVLVLPMDSWALELIKRDIKVDVLLNCAFPRSSDPKQLAKGIPFTEQLMKSCAKLKIPSIVNISSQSVYTQKKKKKPTEEDDVCPENLYGVTKYACERVVSLICENSKINYTNIRLGSLTSLDFDSRLTNRFVKSAVSGDTIQINGGTQELSYLDVRDAAKALIVLINCDSKRWKNKYNLGHEESYRLIDILAKIEEIYKKKYISSINKSIKDGDSNYNNLIDSKLFYKDFSFKPQHTLESMLLELFGKHLGEI